MPRASRRKRVKEWVVFYAVGDSLVAAKLETGDITSQIGQVVRFDVRSFHIRGRFTSLDYTRDLRIASVKSFPGYGGLDCLYDDREWEEKRCTDLCCELFDIQDLACYVGCDLDYIWHGTLGVMLVDLVAV